MMDGGVEGWMHGWIDEGLDGWRKGWMDEWGGLYGFTDEKRRRTFPMVLLSRQVSVFSPLGPVWGILI